MTTTTIRPGKVVNARLTSKQREDMKRLNHMSALLLVSDRPITCPRCSKHGSCHECAAINMERMRMGRIEPSEDPTDNPNNICLQPMSGKFRGHRPVKSPRRSTVGVVAKVEKLGGGWRVGRALLGGTEIYRSKPMRSHEDAWEFAQSRAAVIRMGMDA